MAAFWRCRNDHVGSPHYHGELTDVDRIQGRMGCRALARQRRSQVGHAPGSVRVRIAARRLGDMLASAWRWVMIAARSASGRSAHPSIIICSGRSLVPDWCASVAPSVAPAPVDCRKSTPRPGFEPGTCGLEDRRSIQLSYRGYRGAILRNERHADTQALAVRCWRTYRIRDSDYRRS